MNIYYKNCIRVYYWFFQRENWDFMRVEIDGVTYVSTCNPAPARTGIAISTYKRSGALSQAEQITE